MRELRGVLAAGAHSPCPPDRRPASVRRRRARSGRRPPRRSSTAGWAGARSWSPLFAARRRPAACSRLCGPPWEDIVLCAAPRRRRPCPGSPGCRGRGAWDPASRTGGARPPRGDSEAALALLEPLERTPEVLALRGRALAQARRPGEALSSWEEAAKIDSAALETGPILDRPGGRARRLSGPGGGRPTGEARWPGSACAGRGDAVGRVPQALGGGRCACGAFTQRMPSTCETFIWRISGSVTATSSCARRGRHADVGDERAVEPLHEIAQRKGVLGLTDACEAPAARAALKRLEKR